MYQVAQQAFRRMSGPLENTCNQSVIVSGESGAGKVGHATLHFSLGLFRNIFGIIFQTVSAKHLIKYLVTVADKKQPSRDSRLHSNFGSISYFF